jgi:hypothetical protein
MTDNDFPPEIALEIAFPGAGSLAGGNLATSNLPFWISRPGGIVNAAPRF